MSLYCFDKVSRHRWETKSYKGGSYVVCAACHQIPGHAYDVQRLEELHLLADKHNPRPPSPERAAEYRARMARIDPVTACENLFRALEPQVDDDVLPAAGKAWDAWDSERDPHKKAVLQMELALHVAGLMEQVEALEKRSAPK